MNIVSKAISKADLDRYADARRFRDIAEERVNYHSAQLHKWTARVLEAEKELVKVTRDLVG